jgi:hypothetical protein
LGFQSLERQKSKDLKFEVSVKEFEGGARGRSWQAVPFETSCAQTGVKQV